MWLVSGSAAMTLMSCIGRDAPLISSQDPDRLVPAIKTGVEKKDPHIIPYLVADLESDDSAVRMYSIDGLRRLTGQDFGYVYFDDEPNRRTAVSQWKQWLQDHSADAQNRSADAQGK